MAIVRKYTTPKGDNFIVGRVANVVRTKSGGETLVTRVARWEVFSAISQSASPMTKGKTSANNSGVNLYRLALFVCHKTKLMARPDKVPRYEVMARTSSRSSPGLSRTSESMSSSKFDGDDSISKSLSC